MTDDSSLSQASATDAPVGTAADETAVPEEERRPKRSLWGLLGIIALIVIAILIILMLRGCGGAQSDVTGGSLKTIEPVIGADAQAGMVSVWVEDPARLEAILEEAGLGGADAVDMEGGRYVVSVEPGSEPEAVETLMDIPGVYDAGYVYGSEKDGE